MEFFGNYRGTVLDNNGTMGRCKIYVPGIYPERIATTSSENPEQYAKILPWAEPAMPLFAGNTDETENGGRGQGMCSWPKVGAIVWVFFEAGNIQDPVYFAGTQGSKAWVSDHNQQYVIQTDKVKVTLDDSRANTYTIEIEDNKTESVSGNSTIDITKDKTETITGNLTMDVTGDINIKSGSNINIEAAKSFNLTAGQIMNLKAAKINLN